jgi:glutamyl-tRNA reductase
MGLMPNGDRWNGARGPAADPGVLFSVGIDFRTSRVEVRERWALSDQAARELAQEALGFLDELVMIRTCNRTELVAWSSDPGEHPRMLAEAWARVVGAAPGAGQDGPARGGDLPPIQLQRSSQAVRHLLRVSAGLESQILGDIHILGQVRRSYREARDAGMVGSYLHRLFDAAIRGGKRVRRETDLMAGHRSVGSEAARHLLEQLPQGAPRRIAVLGAGKVGSHAARALAATPGVEVVLLNRTAERAVALAAEWGGEAGGLEQLAEILPGCSGLLVATGAPGAWVDHRVLAHRPVDRVFPVVDLSMPRNVAPEAGRLPGVVLSDLDDVHPETAAVEAARQDAIPQAEAILEEEGHAFQDWVAASTARLALRPLQEWVVEICRKEVRFVAGGDEEMADRAARRIAARVLSRPMMAIRALREEGDHDEEGSADLEFTRALAHLFRDPEAAQRTPSNGVV